MRSGDLGSKQIGTMACPGELAVPATHYPRLR